MERERIGEFLGLRRWGSAIAWGAPAAAILVAADYRFAAMPAGKWLTLPLWNAALLNGVLVSPVAEEIVFRGFCLRRFGLNGMPFWAANLLTSAVFLSLHVVGWWFQGRLLSGAAAIGLAGPVVFLSLVFGWLKQKSRSLYAPILVHAVNNLYVAAVRGG